MDKDKIEEGVKLILEGIGEDLDREGLIDTPSRISRMCEEIFSGYKEDISVNFEKVFEANNNDIIIERNIKFYSVCEHHMMPFYGRVDVAYVPNSKVVGLSKIARTVEVLSKKLQLQEQFTAEIADAIMENVDAKGVMVFVSAKHMCMTMRGIKKRESKTTTIVTRGCFVDNKCLQNYFFKCK